MTNTMTKSTLREDQVCGAHPSGTYPIAEASQELQQQLRGQPACVSHPTKDIQWQPWEWGIWGLLLAGAQAHT